MVCYVGYQCSGHLSDEVYARDSGKFSEVEKIELLAVWTLAAEDMYDVVDVDEGNE